MGREPYKASFVMSYGKMLSDNSIMSLTYSALLHSSRHSLYFSTGCNTLYFTFWLCTPWDILSISMGLCAPCFSSCALHTILYSTPLWDCAFSASLAVRSTPPLLHFSMGLRLLYTTLHSHSLYLVSPSTLHGLLYIIVILYKRFLVLLYLLYV